MTLREFKIKLKEHATSLIPEQLQEYLFTGGSENTHYLYYQSAKEFSYFVNREFDKNDISTQIGSNKKWGMHSLESFKMPIKGLDVELAELVKMSEQDFVESEIRKLEENIQQAFEDPRSSIQQYIEAVEGKLINGGADASFGIMASIGWNSNGWTQPPTEGDLKVANSYGFVSENGHMHEALNFGIEVYPAESDGSFIAYTPKFNKAVKKAKDVKVVFFTSRDPKGVTHIVGLYAFPEIGREFEREASHEAFKVYDFGNVKSSLKDIVLFDQFLVPGTEGYLPGNKQLSKQGFNYLYKSNAHTIFKDAMKANPANEKLKDIYSRLFNRTAVGKSTGDKDTESPDELAGNLNQILFGPPGTGKTYHTVNKALEIIGEKVGGMRREEVKALFDSKVKEGQIVFTTFHQSMSYEDFIEGIKPVEPEQEDTFIKYEVQAGIFKKICQAAKTPDLVAFDSAYESLINDLSELPLLALQTPTGKDFAVSLNQNNNLNLHTGPEKTKQGTLTKENIQKQINGEEKFIGWEGYFKGVINHLKSKYQYSPENGKKVDKNYVLIIDEINRGNVSQIFGELITLIEEDKRLGKAEALEVTLPYSKEKFGVPANLHIIGTMNTADRSIEALDTALRRRFSFSEMEPAPGLLREITIPDLDLELLLTKINKRIERLLDKDHMIGHAYFMKLKHVSDPWKELQVIFHEKLIPLLQEYFYGDYGKIELTIGKAFFEEEEEEADVVFADSDYEFVDALLSKKVYRIRNVDAMDAAEFEQAVLKI